MQVINESCYETSLIHEILDFATTFFEHSEETALWVRDQEPGYLTGGSAYKFPTEAGPVARKVEAPSLVELRLSRHIPYPQTSNAVESVGPVTFHTWEEESLLVLAHELQHIDDIRSGLLNLITVDTAEERAEERAQHILSVYRKSHRQAA